MTENPLAPFEGMPTITFEEGDIACNQGEYGNEFFVLISGSLEVLSAGERVGVISKVGEYFGEVSVLLGTPRSATIKALEKSECYSITGPQLNPLLQKSASEILKQLAQCENQRLDATTQLYRELRELEKMREGLMHMIIHDLRNPLGFISGFTELIQELIKANPIDINSIEDYLKIIMKSIGDMSSMIETLLLIGKMENHELNVNHDDVNISAICQECYEELAGLLQTNEKQISYDTTEDIHYAIADSSLLKRVVQNLLNNAYKYTKSKDSITLKLFSDDKHVIIHVQDTGKGIPPQFQKVAFEKFTQVQARKSGKKFGVGLGLAFCKMAINAMDGEISLESVVGVGTTFIVKLIKHK